MKILTPHDSRAQRILLAGDTTAAVIDPFKPGELLERKTDKATGKPLPGAVTTRNADTLDTSGKHTRDTEIATLVTGKDGTAEIKLDVKAKNGTSLLIGAGGVLVAAGGGAVWARRRHPHTSDSH